MSVQIDLMPDSCRAALGRRARVRSWVAAYLAAIGIVAAAYAIVAAGDGARSDERSRLERQVRLQWERNEEAQAIWAQIRELDATIARHERLAWPVSVGDIIAVVGAELPESTTLTALTVTPRQERLKAAAKPRGERPATGTRSTRTPDQVRTMLAIELEGVAPDDMELSRFVSGLESSPLFQDVVLDFARSRVVDEVEARGFRVTFSVDMSAQYTFVEENAAEVSRAD